MINRRKAFSLIELMVTLLITIALVGGFVLAMNNISTGTRNAARTTDLTNLSRGIFKLMQADLYSTAKGMSDLNMYQIHINSDLAGAGEDLFYGITDLTLLEPGASQIEFQWFNYHRKFTDIDGKEYSLPTFQSTSSWVVVDQSTAVDKPWDNTIPPLTFISAIEDDPELAQIQEGDYFLIYRPDILYDSDLNNLQVLQSKVESDSGLWDETAFLNGAMILQAVGVEAALVPEKYSLDTCGEFHGYLSAATVHFGGTTFSNVLGTNIPLTDYSEAAEAFRCIGKWLTSESAKNLKQSRPPEKTWLARKIGARSNDQDSYNRVSYYRDNDTDTLIRVQNGEEMIVASNVENFEILIGMDVTNTVDDWDGAVSVEETDRWIKDLSEIGATPEAARAIVGRHALAVKVVITFRSIMKDLQDETGDGYKRRTFEQIFRLKNNHLPMRSI